MSAISACIHCCNLARSCIAAHTFPANSACACAQNCNCCTSIHLFNHLFWPTQAIWHPHIPYTTFPHFHLNPKTFLSFTCLPPPVWCHHLMYGLETIIFRIHIIIRRECVLWVAVFLCMESALCRQQSLPRDYICSHSQLWAVTLSLSHQPLFSGQKNKGLVKRHPNSLFWTNICPKL